jgi:hypothetical protein
LSKFQKNLAGAVIFGLLFLGLIGKRYYAYVNNTKSPFDEVGISLHALMPAPIQSWGCAKLRATFEQTTAPPHGCTSTSGTYGWR